MKLYFSPGACSMSPHIALIESGLGFTTEKVDLRKKVTETGADYTTINPKGYVPALEMRDGTILTEGPAIVQYIADLVPEKRLAPAPGSAERYRLVEWLNFIATEVHKNFSPLFNPAASADVKNLAIDNLGKRLGYAGKVLEERDYLVGNDFTVADGYLFTVLNWAGSVQLELPSSLQAYHARIGARPSVRQAMLAEGLVKE